MIARSLSYWLAVAALIGAIIFVSGALRAADVDDIVTAAATASDLNNQSRSTGAADFCDALNQIIDTAPDDFAPIKGEKVARKSWEGRVQLPGVGQCTVLDVLGTAYECRGMAGGWDQEKILQAEILTLGRALDQCLLNGRRQGVQEWTASSYQKSPPGFAKFYRSGRVHVYLGTSVDIRSKGFYNSVRVEM